jgi:hypothetical protein
MQYKLITGNPLEYKPMKESQVPESYTLPKIQLKDFQEYFNKVKIVSLKCIMYFEFS